MLSAEVALTGYLVYLFLQLFGQEFEACFFFLSSRPSLQVDHTQLLIIGEDPTNAVTSVRRTVFF